MSLSSYHLLDPYTSASLACSGSEWNHKPIHRHTSRFADSILVSDSGPVKVLLVGVDHFDLSHSDALFHERSSPADECHLEELLLH